MKKKILIIGKIPPPIGGVTIHIKRLIYNLESVNEFEVLLLDYSCKVHFFSKFYKILSSHIIHLHLSNKLLRLLFVCSLKLIGKNVIVTFHGNYSFVNLLDYFSLKYCSHAILLNQQTYSIAVDLVKNEKCHLIGAFISPIKEIESDNDRMIANRISEFKKKHRNIFCMNATMLALDNNGEEIYKVSETIKLFKLLHGNGLVFSDPSDSYISYLQQKKIDIPENVLIINKPHDFTNVIKLCNGLIRNTSTDGDSISVKEGLYFGKRVYATKVVNRPLGTIEFNQTEELIDLLERKQLKFSGNNIKSSFDEILRVYRSIV